ncbi:MAG: hypothetical protein HYW90_01465 [Candidatus Sungbacteria bacterium]|nr:hypothetical protein [Candidatus Sungbacteria bacterium]
MRRLRTAFQIITAIFILLIPAPLVFAGQTLLAREEVRITADGGVEAIRDALGKEMPSLIERMENHQCAIKARSEERILKIRFNVIFKEVVDGNHTIVMEVYSDECS